ncbi:hypothetical protein AC578_3772 [Pseudocercospora eumusae]|uniref:ABC transporter n=1 Tax=Pseudocercospora eumusae TaxID=321146 RepID=A0A139HAL9_9PEZI|nr:hypothetical protein AC578_3772 [Pseudocercospora eumusae]
MRGPNVVAQKAWSSLGNGALFTHRIHQSPAQQLLSRLSPKYFAPHSSPGTLGICQARCISNLRSAIQQRPTTALLKQSTSSILAQKRVLQTSPPQQESLNVVQHGDKLTAYKNEVKSGDPADAEEEKLDFKKTEKASQASQVNLSAKLSSTGKDGENKTKGGWREVTRLLRIARPEAKSLALAFVFLLISSSITMSIPFSIGRILDMATKEEGTLFGLTLSQFCIALSTLLSLGALANYGRIILLRIVGERIVAKLRSTLFKRTYIQNAEFFDANRTGDLISRLGSDTIIVGKSITQNLSDGLRSMVSAGAAMGMMSYVSFKLIGVLAFAFPPIAAGAFLYGRAIRDLSRRIQKNLGTLTKIAEERLGNVRTSQAFAGELQEVHRYNSQVRKIFALGKREAFISATFFSFSGFMGNATFITLLYVGSGMVRSGAMTIGDLTTFLMYTGYAGSSIFGLSSFYSELMKGVGAATRLFELQDREPTISPTKGDMVKSARGMIEFKDVAFAYPTRPAVSIFDGLNFRIPQGSNVAIVAPSGAGKSTVASLLMRFYTPTRGEITINGKSINDMNAKQLRRRIGYVGQEPVLFSGTIAENIAYGKPLASRSEIVGAARRANCQFISDFPDGLETFVGARGAQLSGGQKQRIAIARALLKNPDILILDEATSALDAESETLVNQALQALLRGDNTTISIAHRLSTIQRSDTIIVIGTDGKVAQVGPYRDLAADKEGAFAKLMEWQMSGGQAAQQAPRKQEEEENELTEEERMRARMKEHARERGEQDGEDSEHEGHHDLVDEPEWEGVKVKKDEQSVSEDPVTRAGLRDGGYSRKGY